MYVSCTQEQSGWKEAEKFPPLARGFSQRKILYQVGPFPLFSNMNQLRIDGELTGYTRRPSKADFGRLVRTFLIAMFIGVVVAGVYFAINPIVAG